MNITARILFLLLSFLTSAVADIYTVNNTDDPGNGVCNASGCTLREAITAANANPGPDTINFNLPTVINMAILPLTALPTITETVTIDGYTQPGASENTLTVGDDAEGLVPLAGYLAGPLTIGLNIAADGCVIRGLVVSEFGNVGININGNGNIIEGNFIGLYTDGSGGMGNGFRGVSITTGDNNLIGGPDPAARNLISANGSSGVVIFCCDDTGNVIQGNYIGTDRNGTKAVGNGGDGINVNGTSFDNQIGGTAPGAGNLVSGNAGNGIRISDGGGGVAGGDNIIQGNLIGTDATGSGALGNKGNGIFIENAANNQVGGSAAGAGNIISGNGLISSDTSGHGVLIMGTPSTANKVQGNFIGTNAEGSAALGNVGNGVYVFASSGNTIGGPVSGARNVVSGNLLDGIVISPNSSEDNLVQGNFIGTDASGKAEVGNALNGVSLVSAQNNTIGGTTAGAGNVISGNETGVAIYGIGAVANRIQSNFIGTDLTGILPIGNTTDGVICGLFANDNLVGGPAGAGNQIAFNGVGVRVFGDTTTGNNIFGNAIFGNNGLGIDLDGGSEDANGVTSNDFSDSDSGPNELQNYPALIVINLSGEDRTVEGQLSSNANTDYVLNFYSNTKVDPSGYGEGETWLGSLDVHTNAQGTINFTYPLDASARGGYITATATDPAGNTSEFSMASEIVPPLNRFQNISTRLRVQTGDNVLIGGFIITGDDPKEVIVRAIGPSLGDFGVADPLANPILELHYPDGTTVVTNNNWRDDQETEIEATGLAPSKNLESAILITLEPGAYTAIVRGVNSGTGVALVETYDLSSGGDSALANISTRGLVETGDNVMIGGIIVGPDTAPSGSILLRGIGPSLGDFGIANPLSDPMLELRDGNGALVTANDNWRSTQETAIEATGLAPSDDLEAAILADLVAGPYTAILSGVNSTTGIGLVEAYHLD